MAAEEGRGVDVNDDMISVGVLTPHNAAGPDVEFPLIAPGRVATHIARVSAPGVTTSSGETPQPTGLRELATPQALQKAAAAFEPGSVDGIGYASTSSAYAIGVRAETALVAQLAQQVGLPVASTGLSAVRALRVLDVTRIALVHPPWFDDQVNQLGAAYFASQGFTVVTATSAELCNDPQRIEAGAVAAWITHNLPADAEAIFIGGNGFTAAGAIDMLEAADGPAILESNQVLLWDLLALTGASIQIHDFGRLFAHL